jgi:hypothetical protein
MNVEIGTVARNSFSGNTCFKDSVLVLCSVPVCCCAAICSELKLIFDELCVEPM